MNLFLDYLVVTALFALVLLPAGLGIARERRIDRQLRDAARGEAEPTETERAARPVAATRRSSPTSGARASVGSLGSYLRPGPIRSSTSQ
ncbi:hypothetical protein GCM10010231_00420 [Streptomyces sindenensis]|nr:hypothetical protein GCM10010231_00420 [Streptomyces sindenensis]